jgi:leucyl/phenylalanyl-tRNA--protein transferase
VKLYATQRKFFPDPRHALEEGIVEVSDDVRVERLFEAYSFGIFPWPQPNLPVLWFCPDPRGVLDFAQFHVPRSLHKAIVKSPLHCTFNRCFDLVVAACARVPRPGQEGTWISDRLCQAYGAFHRAGYAHSLEVWNGDDLVGGLYGVYVAGVFCGESMFYTQPNASKIAVVRLVECLRANGLQWMDIQMVTPVLEQMGGSYISREDYLSRLELAKARARALDFTAL